MAHNSQLKETGTFLLHIKALIWCLCKAEDRYNLKKIKKALRARTVPQELVESTIGQNLSFILGFLSKEEDYETLITALKHSVDDIHQRGGRRGEVHHPSGDIICEVGHYVQAMEDIGSEVPKGAFGVLDAFANSDISILFYVEDRGLRLVECDSAKVRFIFGTTIFTPSGETR